MSKAKDVCYLIYLFGPMTRKRVLYHAHVLARSTKEFKPRSNTCYFAPTRASAGGHSSLVVKGLVEPVAKVRNELVYGLTVRGWLLGQKAAFERQTKKESF